MTKNEIIALIDAKIAGQGTNIDAGAALPEILKGILELLPEPSPNVVGVINGEFVGGKMILTPEQVDIVENYLVLVVNDLKFPIISSITYDQIHSLESAASIPTDIVNIWGSIFWEGSNPDSASAVIYANDTENNKCLFSFEL